jgi:pimeloyl-ACP methyl ester carboxylesterase
MEDALRFEDYPAVAQPTLFFHGLRDETAPCSLSEEFVRRNPNARLERVDDGHELLDNMERIRVAAEAFL